MAKKGRIAAPKVKKILILAANPKDMNTLRLDKEVREIEEGFRRSKHRDSFQIVQKWAIQIEDLRRALLDHEPHIVHFCGHGEQDGITMLDKDDNAFLVNPQALSELFEILADKIECVILNACYSEQQANGISCHISYVIGMKKEIGDEAAIKFSIGFYDGIGAGESFEKAFKLGKNSIRLENIPEHLTPVLKKKSNSLTSQGGQSVTETGIELKINCEFDKFTPDEQNRILGAIRELLEIDSDLKISKIRRGSVVITLKLKPQQAIKLLQAVESGKLKEYGVINAELVDLEIESDTLKKAKLDNLSTNELINFITNSPLNESLWFSLWSEFCTRFHQYITSVISREIKKLLITSSFLSRVEEIVDDIVGEVYKVLLDNDMKALRAFKGKTEDAFFKYLEKISKSVAISNHTYRILFLKRIPEKELRHIDLKYLIEDPEFKVFLSSLMEKILAKSENKERDRLIFKFDIFENIRRNEIVERVKDELNIDISPRKVDVIIQKLRNELRDAMKEDSEAKKE